MSVSFIGHIIQQATLIPEHIAIQDKDRAVSFYTLQQDIINAASNLTQQNVKTGDNTYGYTGQDERSTGGVNMSRAGILSGTSKPKENYNVGGRNMRHTGGR